MSRESCHPIRPTSLAFLGVSLLCAMPQAAAEPLTKADVESVMTVRKVADRLRLKAIEEASRRPGTKDQPFAALMEEIQRIAREADERASRRHGLSVREYRRTLRRLVNVNELLSLEGAAKEMREELLRLQSMGEEELRAEAERKRVETEEWLKAIKSSKVAPSRGGATREEGNRTNGKPVPSGYAESLEEQVVEPMRRQTANGTWVENVRRANERRMEEIRGRLRKLDGRLSSEAMRQAAADKPLVVDVVDRETLKVLNGSLVEEIRKAPVP